MIVWGRIFEVGICEKEEVSHLPRSMSLSGPDHWAFLPYGLIASWVGQGSYCSMCAVQLQWLSTSNVWLTTWAFASDTSILPLQPQREISEYSQKMRLSFWYFHTLLKTGSRHTSHDCLAQAHCFLPETALGSQSSRSLPTHTFILDGVRGRE